MIQSPYPGFASNYSTHGSLNKQGIYKATDRSYKSYSAFKILGRGSFGLVYLATTSENKRVAVKSKLYLNDFNLMNKSIQFFRGELEALFNMKHPNIIRLLGVEFESNEVSSLILEYVEGETLDKYIHKHQALSEKNIKLFTRQIVEAVAHMHAKLVMHRDIKSSNVMVVNERWIKVIDFGMAKRLNVDDMGLNMSTSTIVGTVRTRRALRFFNLDMIVLLFVYGVIKVPFMAPEVRNFQRYNSKADVFSIGALVYDMANGDPFVRIKNEWNVITETLILSQHQGQLIVATLSIAANSFIQYCLIK